MPSFPGDYQQSQQLIYTALHRNRQSQISKIKGYNSPTMRKILLTLLLIISTACNFLIPIHGNTPPATATPSFRVITHPDGPLYAGDKVSFEVISPAGFETSNRLVRINLAEKTLGEQGFQPFGMSGRNQATFYWIWDTQGLNAGDYTLTFSLLPGDLQWDEKFTLLPAADVPSPEPDALWESVNTNCCVIHYISGTDAEKDLETLKSMVDTQALDVETRFGTKIKGKIAITFMPRVLGHGGFASDGIYVSYLHQNYAGGTTSQVSHHEMVHWLDGQQHSDLRLAILQEGLAVYLSDGHFKTEPILPRAAALLDLGWYIPLPKLADSFYFSQHETGYAEAAALISYLITTYGRGAFDTFYQDIHPAPDGSQATALDSALKTHFQISLEQLDQNFTNFLRQQTFSEAERTDIRLTVSFYDTVRRYQQILDPSAYFLNAWLPNIPEMRQRGIVADLLRRPNAAVNQQIESLLVDGDANLRAANYSAAEADIRAVNVILDIYNYLGK